LGSPERDETEGLPDSASPGPTEEIPRLTPPEVAVYRSPEPAPTASAPEPTRSSTPAPRAGTPADPAGVPLATAASSTPDPGEGAMFSPVLRERADGGGGEAWFLQTGQPVPERGSLSSEPAPVVKPSRAPMLIVMAVGAVGVGMVVLIAIIAAFLM
jgi:hypothetical protein